MISATRIRTAGRRLILLPVIALMLSGCAETSVNAGTAATKLKIRDPDVARQTEAEQRLAAKRAADRKSIARVPAASGAESSLVAEDPSKLLGLNRKALAAILGAPPFIRRDTTMQLWRYSNEICVLHVYFYRSDGGEPDKLTVHHFEARTRLGALSAPAACLTEILAAR